MHKAEVMLAMACARQHLIGPMLGFKSFQAAQCTTAGVELMHMLKKKQQIIETGEENLTAAEQFYALAASFLYRPGQLIPNCLHTKICDGTAKGRMPN
jgi:hypothetical protein